MVGTTISLVDAHMRNISENCYKIFSKFCLLVQEKIKAIVTVFNLGRNRWVYACKFDKNKHAD
jgi:hypothetical protein